MKIRKGFVLRGVCGEQVIMGEGIGALDFGKLLCLNETAAFLWKRAEALDDFTVDALADALQREYAVAPEQARADVASIVGEWQRVSVIE